MRFGPLDPRAVLAEGDELVTATFPGSAVPSGIPIGRVISQDERSSRLTSVFRVLPFADAARLDHVLVVLSGPAPVVPPFEDSDGLDVGRDVERDTEADGDAG
jgi:cell shape-determining protein MreC